MEQTGYLGLDEHTVLRRLKSPQIEYVEVAGETVIYHCDHHRTHLLDRTGTLVWRLIDGVTSVGEMSRDLADVFGQPLPAVLGDVHAFASQLEAAGVVERAR